MAKIKKKAPKSQIQPGEEFRTIAGHAAEYYTRYQKQANTVLTIVVIVLLVWAISSLVGADREKKAGRMFESAYALFSPGGASSVPNYPQALLGFQEIVRTYGGTASGASAQYYVGNTLAAMGRFEEAIKAYEECASRYSGRKVVAGLAFQRLGFLYARTGKNEDALNAFGKAESLIGPGIATMEEARLYERLGNSEAALKKYQEVSDQLPATTLALEARTKLPTPDLQNAVGAAPEEKGK